jgi:hypothetical protein
MVHSGTRVACTQLAQRPSERSDQMVHSRSAAERQQGGRPCDCQYTSARRTEWRRRCRLMMVRNAAHDCKLRWASRCGTGEQHSRSCAIGRERPRASCPPALPACACCAWWQSCRAWRWPPTSRTSSAGTPASGTGAAQSSSRTHRRATRRAWAESRAAPRSQKATRELSRR